MARPRMRAHWRHLANTIELSVCGGDAALCQITLTTCYKFPNTHYSSVESSRNELTIQLTVIVLIQCMLYLDLH